MSMADHHKAAIRQLEDRIRFLTSHQYHGVGRDLMDLVLAKGRFKEELRKLNNK